jgi:MFS family permease
MDFYRHLFRRNPFGKPITFALVYLISVVFTFQTLVTAYSSSTYLERFLSPEGVSMLFGVSAAGAIVVSLLLPRILERIGNVSTTLLLMLVATITLVLVGMNVAPVITLIAFTLFMMVNPQIYLNIDIFLETLIGEEEHTTGTKRGLILTIMSVAAFLSPLAMGYIIGAEQNLAAVYYVGAVVGVIFIMLIVAFFRKFSDPVYTQSTVTDMVQAAKGNLNIKTVLTTQFLLQFFYTWAIIYVPLFLATEVGFDWTVISQILAAGLLAFIIFEYPIGVLADTRFGEKEMMAIGFVILALASASISFAATIGVAGWMLLMFISRLGASLVEVTTESYFFKQVTSTEAASISLFRLTRPLANLAGALVGFIALYYLPFNFIFFVLAALMALGVFITSFLTDTK